MVTIILIRDVNYLDVFTRLDKIGLNVFHELVSVERQDKGDLLIMMDNINKNDVITHKLLVDRISTSQKGIIRTNNLCEFMEAVTNKYFQERNVASSAELVLYEESRIAFKNPIIKPNKSFPFHEKTVKEVMDVLSYIDSPKIEEDQKYDMLIKCSAALLKVANDIRHEIEICNQNIIK